MCGRAGAAVRRRPVGRPCPWPVSCEKYETGIILQDLADRRFVLSKFLIPNSVLADLCRTATDLARRSVRYERVRSQTAQSSKLAA